MSTERSVSSRPDRRTTPLVVRNYDTHYVNDRFSNMRQEVEGGNLDLAVHKLVGYLRRTDPERPVSLYEEKTTHRVEWAELRDPREDEDYEL